MFACRHHSNHRVFLFLFSSFCVCVSNDVIYHANSDSKMRKLILTKIYAEDRRIYSFHADHADNSFKVSLVLIKTIVIIRAMVRAVSRETETRDAISEGLSGERCVWMGSLI